MAEPVRLNLGCGERLWPGFVNIDLPDTSWTVKPDIACDIRKLSYADDSVDEIHAIHVFEHFYFLEAPRILTEWYRVLKPGCPLILELPCLEKILAHFRSPTIDFRLTWLGLYGDQIEGNVAMLHKWCYSQPMIKEFMQQAGFRDIHIGEPVFHVPVRDMRVTGIK